MIIFDNETWNYLQAIPLTGSNQTAGCRTFAGDNDTRAIAFSYASNYA